MKNFTKLLTGLWPRKLSQQISLQNLLVLVAVMTCFAALTVFQQHTTYTKQDEQELLVLVNTVAVIATRSGKDNIQQVTENEIRHIVEYPGVEKIQLIVNKVPVLSVRKSTNGRIVTETTASTIKTFDPDEPLISIQGDLISIRKSFTPESGEYKSGWVLLQYNNQLHDNLVIKLIKQSLSAALLPILISIFVLRSMLKRPVRELEKAAEFAEYLDLKQGNEADLTKSCDETENLVRVLNQTSGRLRLQDEIQRNKFIMLETVCDIQSTYIKDKDAAAGFEKILRKLMQISKSENGFFGEVLLTEDNKPYIQMRNIAGVPNIQTSNGFYDASNIEKLKFYNMDTLFGAILQTKKPVIANDAVADPRRGNLPEEHFPIDRFLGLPIFSHNRVVGVICLANRKEYYEQGLIAHLQPLLTICAHMVEGLRNEASRKRTQKELTRKNNSLKAILSRVSDGVISLSRNGEIRSVNTAGAKMFGYYEDEINNRNIDMLMPEVSVDIANEMLPGTNHLMQVLGVKKNGDTVHLELDITQYRHAEDGLYVITIRDNHAKPDAVQEKKPFHLDVDTIRKKLSAMRGMMMLLFGSLTKDMSNEDKKFSQELNDGFQGLINQFDCLYMIDDYETAETELSLRALKFSKILQSALNDSQDLCRDFGVSIKLSDCDSCSVSADENNLQQAVRILLKKVIGEARRGSTVEVSSKLEEGHVRLYMSSQVTTENVDANDISRYFREDPELYLCLLIIERHGGVINCFSHDHGGLEFYVSMPVLKEMGSTRYG